MFRQIGLVIVNIPDLDEGLAFYRDSLGLQPDYVDEENEDFATFPLRGSTLALQVVPTRRRAKAEVRQRYSPVQIVFYVDDLQETVARLADQGVEVVGEVTEHGFGWLTGFRDPWGNVHLIEQPKRTR